jgi:hypothetical protein
MDNVDVWILLGGWEARPRRVVRSAEFAMGSVLRRLPLASLQQPQPPARHRHSKRRWLLPTDLLAHRAYAVTPVEDLDQLIEPWIEASALWDDLLFVLRLSQATGTTEVSIQAGLARIQPQVIGCEQRTVADAERTTGAGAPPAEAMA